MDLTYEDVLRGEDIVDYSSMDLSFEEEMRLEHKQQVRLIRKGALMAPKHLTREEAENSMFAAGNDYRRDWLEANESKLDPYDLFWLTVDAYSDAPYKSIPKKRIIDLRKIRPSDYLKDLDPELADIDPITIYRGSSCFPERVKNEFSWTTDLITAIFFYSKKKETFDMVTHGEGITKENIDAIIDDLFRFGVVSEPKVWKATITKDKIIATFNERDEHEVIQHCNVKNIQEVALTPEEVETALTKWKSRSEAWNQQIIE